LGQILSRRLLGENAHKGAESFMMGFLGGVINDRVGASQLIWPMN